MTIPAAEDSRLTIPAAEDNGMTIPAAEDNGLTIPAAEDNGMTIPVAEDNGMTIPAAEDHEISTSQTGNNTFVTFCEVKEPQLITEDHVSINGDSYIDGLMHTTIEARTGDQLSVCGDHKSGAEGCSIVQLASSLAASSNEVEGDQCTSETSASDKVPRYSSVSEHRVMTQSASDRDTAVIATPDKSTAPDCRDTKLDQSGPGPGVECRYLKDHARTDVSVTFTDCTVDLGEGQLYSSQPSDIMKTVDVPPLEAALQQQSRPNPFKPMSMQEVCLATETSSGMSLYGQQLAEPPASKNRGASRRTHLSSLPLHTESNTHAPDPVKMGQTSLVRRVARYFPLRQCVFVISVAAVLSVLSILVLKVGFSVSEGNKPM